MMTITSWARRIPLHRLLFSCAVAAAALDVLSGLYFARYWMAKDLGRNMWSMALSLQGQSWDTLEPHYRDELINVLTMSAGMMLTTLLVVNMFFYAYLPLRKRWAWQYVLTYTLTAAAMALLTAFEGFQVSFFWDAMNLISIPAYLALSYFVWARKAECSEKGFRIKRG